MFLNFGGKLVIVIFTTTVIKTVYYYIVSKFSDKKKTINTLEADPNACMN